MRMQLSGGKEVAAEAQVGTAAVEEQTAAVEAANKKVTRSGNAIRSSLTKQITAIRTIGRSLTKYVALPLAAIAIGSGVMAAKFDRSMNLVATDAGGSVKEVAKLKGQVLDLARHSQFGPQGLADSLFHVESAGYRGAKAIRVLNEAQKLATSGNSDLEKTTYALVSAQKALHNSDSLKGITKTAAQLNEIVSHGDIRLEELTSAMSTGLLPTAKALGLSVADVGSALDVMTKRGIPAQRSAYALNFTLQKLVPSTEKAEKAFGALGIGQEQLLKTAQTKGLPAALGLLSDKLSGLTRGRQIQVIDEMFGGGRMSKGLLVAIQHVGEMRELWEQVDGNVALYKKHVREAEAQPLVRAKAAWSSIEAGLIEIGEVLLPAVIPLMEEFAAFLGGIASGFAALPASTQHTIVAVAGLAAALGPVLLITAKLLELWKSIKEISAVQAATAGMTKGRLAVAGAGVIGSQTVGGAVGGTAGSAISNIGTGAALGFGVGGPWGAALGGGLGAALTFGPAILGLASAEKTLSPLQEKIARGTEKVGSAMGAAHDQVRRLTHVETELTAVKHHHKGAAEAVARGEHRLEQIRGKLGPNSLAAIRAEIRLAEAKEHVNHAISRQHHLEHARKGEVQVTKELLRVAILEERAQLRRTQKSVQQARERRRAAKEEGKSLIQMKPFNEALTKATGQLQKAQKQQAETILEASTKIGPKYATFLRNGSEASIKFGGAAKGARHEVGRLRREVSLAKLAIDNYRRSAEDAAAAVEETRLGTRHSFFGPHGPSGPGSGLKGALRREEERVEELENRHHHHAHHRNTEANASPNSSKALEALFGGGAKTKRVHHQPVVFALDAKGKRVLAEGVVEVQEDDEARL